MQLLWRKAAMERRTGQDNCKLSTWELLIILEAIRYKMLHRKCLNRYCSVL
jgi:hypothetical protein